MKVTAEKRVLIELTLEEAVEFYRDFYPEPRTFGKRLDAALKEAINGADGWDAA